MKICIILVLLIATGFSLQAQDKELLAQQPPAGPLLKRASAPSEWTIVTQVVTPQPGLGNDTGATGNSENPVKPAKPANPKVTTVIKDENLIYEKTVNEFGDLIEVWRTSAAIVTRVNDKDWTALPGTGNNFNISDYSKDDFAGFDWIALSNFTGRGNISGKKCLIFKSRVIIMGPQELHMARVNALTKLIALHPGDTSITINDVSDDQFKVDVEADIDEETRLPVALTYETPQGTNKRSYTFKPAESSLSLPPDAQQALDKYEKYLKGMSARIAPI